MKSHKKIFLLILLAVLLCLLAFFAIKIYAKYIANATGNTSLAVAKWNLKVNNQAITNNTTLTQNLVPTIPATTYAAANVIVPGAKGYVTLNLDYTNVNVSFKYTISLGTPTGVTDLKIIGYTLGTNVNPANITSSANIITGNIPMNSTPKTKTINVWIEWPEPGTMTDAQDTAQASIDTEATSKTSAVPVNIVFEQIV